MVERSLASFVVLMAAMAYVTQAWHVLALRAVQGLFAGYGSLSVAMAAESAPRERLSSAIGLVQTAQRLGPGVGPVLGGALAAIVGLRQAFIATAMFYGIALVVVFWFYDERVLARNGEDAAVATMAADVVERITFRRVLGFRDFMLMMAVIFGLQFVDRSFGPILPLYVEQVGTAHARVPLVAGVLFSIMACTGALGHHFCAKLLHRFAMPVVIAWGVAAAGAGSALLMATGNLWAMGVASILLGIGVGAAMTASYTAAGRVIPAGAHGAAFGVLTSASLAGMAVSPFIAGVLGGTSIRAVFALNVVLMAALAVAVPRMMTAER
jgi:DHA1 family multidrug resistance protein-like MFS transporter